MLAKNAVAVVVVSTVVRSMGGYQSDKLDVPHWTQSTIFVRFCMARPGEGG